MKISWKTFAPLAVWLVLYLIPVPAGLQPNQWHYFAIFAAVIAGLILESMPVGAIGPGVHARPPLTVGLSVRR